MTDARAMQISDDSCAALHRLFQSHRIRLGPQQRRRLEWLVARCGAPIVWEKQGTATADKAGLIIALEPPTGPSAEQFYNALHPGSVVAIPFGENPVFDFLKSKLTDFGTIGASGADGPHELWWGGRGWPTSLEQGAALQPLVISCYPREMGHDKAARLEESLRSLGLDYVIEPIDTVVPGELLGYEKSGFILNVWERHDRPVLWVEPDAVMSREPALLAAIDCDFAVHKWNRWEMAPRTLYFGRSSAAETMLRTWHRFALSYPAIWDGYIVDQAWSGVTSQIPLDTVWLPRAFHMATDDQGTRKTPVVIHDFETTTADLGPDPVFPNERRVARRAGRIGAPESTIVIKSPDGSRGAVTVILRDTQAAGARAVAASIEAVTRAFTKDCGGFSHLELSLCPWQDDVKAVASMAEVAKSRVLEIAPLEDMPSNMFSRFADSVGRSRRNVVPLRSSASSLM